MRRSLGLVVAVVAGCLVLWATVGPLTPLSARIEGGAMSPTLNDQDRVIVNRLAYRLSSPRRGHVVMLRYPVDQRRSFLKRIIAQGGDSLRIDDGRVYVNDQPLDERYVAPDGRSHDDLPRQVIPAAHYFVMGDRRNNSADSRHWGLVPERLIVGRVTYRYWPNVRGVE